jgi:hypothetical protein
MRALVARIMSVAVAVTMVTFGLAAASARANGYCGPDPVARTACPVTTSETLTGTITAVNERDYYVFYARPDTLLTLTVTNTEDPRCSFPLSGFGYCGYAYDYLYDATGNLIAGSGISTPLNGVTVPKTITRTLKDGGVYYIEVTSDLFLSQSQIPYTLAVSGDPDVRWPPLCTVPKLRHDTTLARAATILRDHYCLPGKIRRVRGRHVKSGDVVGLRPHAGAVEPFHHRVAILVSR